MKGKPDGRMEEPLQTKGKNAIMQTLDTNGDGKIDIEDIIVQTLRLPGVHVDRAEFLEREFKKNYSQNIVNQIIQSNPAQVRINPREVDRMADEVIKLERVRVSGISTALGMPGGLAMAATIPADLLQYYGALLRAAQKLMYLYGFPQIEKDNEKASFDTTTLNVLIMCLGVMFGVQEANTVLKVVSSYLGNGVSKQLGRRIFTRGTLYPFVKSISKWFNVSMSRRIYADFFKKAIPVMGGVIGGGITYFSFKPCCDRLKNVLCDTRLSNPDYHETAKEKKLREAIEVEYRDVN